MKTGKERGLVCRTSSGFEYTSREFFATMKAGQC